MKLKITSKKDFVNNVLDPISSLNDKAILKIEKDKISSLTAASDATLILYSETRSVSDSEQSINIPDVKKFIRVLDCVEGEELEMDINNNNIKYAGNDFKFTFHLLEDGIIKLPAINMKKVNDLKFDTVFKVSESKLASLYKGASFTTETNKLYIFFENNKIYGELGDKSRHNSDNFQCVLADTFTGTSLSKNIPINFETFRLINFNKCVDVEFSINLTLGILKVVLTRDNTTLTYIVSALIN